MPDRCPVDPGDPGAVAAAIRTQGQDLSARPVLTEWPTVAEMGADIAGVYDRVLHRPVGPISYAGAH